MGHVRFPLFSVQVLSLLLVNLVTLSRSSFTPTVSPTAPTLASPLLYRSTRSATDTRECPCTFVIAAAKDTPNLDFLVYVSETSVPFNREPHPRFSSWNQGAPHAFKVDSMQRFHYLIVNQTITVTLAVRTSARSVARSSRLHFRILPAARQQNEELDCPVVVGSRMSVRGNPLVIDDGNAEPSRIVNGRKSSSELRKYLVAFLTEGPYGTSLCSGTLVSPTVAITAAHCAFNFSTTMVYGAKYARRGEGTVLDITGIQPYWEFDPDADISRSSAYDMVIIRFKRMPYKVEKNMGFMKVNVNKSVPEEGSHVRNVGYGVINEDPTASNDYALRDVDSPVVQSTKCAEVYSNMNMLIQEDRQVCVGYMGIGGCGACKGDSGGPLIQYDNSGLPVLVGVVSSGIECADDVYPTIHVRTSAFEEFIPWNEGVVKSYDAVAVYSDAVPTPRKPRNMLFIVVISIGAVAAFVTISLIAGWIIKKRTDYNSTIDQSSTCSLPTEPPSAYLPSPPTSLPPSSSPSFPYYQPAPVALPPSPSSPPTSNVPDLGPSIDAHDDNSVLHDRTPRFPDSIRGFPNPSLLDFRNRTGPAAVNGIETLGIFANYDPYESRPPSSGTVDSYSILTEESSVPTEIRPGFVEDSTPSESSSDKTPITEGDTSPGDSTTNELPQGRRGHTP